MKRFFKTHASSILSGLAVVGTIATAVFAARATIEAKLILEDESYEFKQVDDDLTPYEAIKRADFKPVEIVKLTYKEYIPTVACGLATIFCIIGANHINEKHLAAAIGACTATNKLYKDYRKKADEVFGSGTDSRIRAAMCKEYIDDEDTILIYDELFDDYYTIPMDKVVFDDGLECYIINSRNLHDI